MDKEDLKALNRARVTAGWSYLGALVPLVGWILGGISLSNIGAIDTPESKKDKKRVLAVKKLAMGGLVLSTIIALLYGTITAWNIQASNKAALQAQQAKSNADEQTCEQQVIQQNNKIFSLNSQYPSSNALGGFDNASNPSDCKNGTDAAISKAKTGYESAVRTANQRCINAANDDYTKYLQLNAVYTDKDANGQTIYHLTQANTQYAQNTLQQAKNTCNQQFAVSTN